MRQFEFQDACTFLGNATETFLYSKTFGKGSFFKVAIKYKGVKKFLGSFARSVFNTQYYLNNEKKTRDDETNSKTYEVKKCIYRVYITSLDFKIKQKHHTYK